MKLQKQDYWVIPIILLFLLSIANSYRWDYVHSKQIKEPVAIEYKWKTDRWTGYSWIEIHKYDYELKMWFMEEEPEYSDWEVRYNARQTKYFANKIWGALNLVCIIWLLLHFIILPKYRNWKNGKSHDL